MECQTCQHDARDEKYLCRRCETILKENLSEIPELNQKQKVSWFQDELGQDHLPLKDQ